jgi:hypothetical protein
MPAPADYIPLSAADVATLRDLFRSATGGVELLACDPQSPSNWIGEFWLATNHHMNTLRRLAAARPGTSDKIGYDPRQHNA